MPIAGAAARVLIAPASRQLVGETHGWMLRGLRRRIDFSRASIPAFFYENQPDTIETWGADVFLLAREDLDEEVAFTVLRTLFDNLKELLHAHTPGWLPIWRNLLRFVVPMFLIFVLYFAIPSTWRTLVGLFQGG